MIPIRYVSPDNQRQLVQQMPERSQLRLNYTSNLQRQDAENRDPALIVADPDELRRFVKRVYQYAYICIAIACLTWSATILTKFDLEGTILIPKYVWLILTFTFLITITCIPELLYTSPCNLIMMLCIVLFVIIEGIYLVYEIDMKLFLLGVLGAFLMQVAFYGCSAFCPQENLADIYLMLLILMSFVIVMILIASLIAILTYVHSSLSQLLFLLFFLLFILLSISISSKYICGQFEITLHDTVFNSLTIFIQFSFLLFVSEHIFTCIRRKYL